MQKEYKHQLFKYCDDLFPQLVEALQTVVKIPSVEGTPTKDAPFGENVRKALDVTLQIAKNLGFTVHHEAGYVGYAQLGSQAQYVAALGHLDVVPEGKGWKYPPYGGEIDHSRIYGRGVLDNKGPILSCLFAMKAIEMMNQPHQHAIRILFGTNEETGFHDIPHYLAKEQPPLVGFTPDCKYPVVYGERGRLQLRLLYQGKDEETFFPFLNEYFLASDHSGKELGIDYQDEEFGVLQVGGFRMIHEAKQPGFQFSIQYPASLTKAKLMKQMTSILPSDIMMKEMLHYEPVCFDKNGELIKTLQEAYEEVMQVDGSPVTTTGGTYAKVMPNIVPFGPSFPGQKGIAHLSDEWMDLDDLKKNMKIYAYALSMLADKAEF